jgi:hypothetical protein
VALDHEDVEFLAFGHPLVDQLVARVQDREFGGATGYRVIHARDAESSAGWFFTFALEFEGLTPIKELLPVYIGDNGTMDEARAQWLLDASSSLYHENAPTDGVPVLPETIAEVAESVAGARLLLRRSELEESNRERQRIERAKLERYFEYRERAAAAKLASVQRTFDRLSASDEPSVLRIMPVWVKNLENARRVLEATTADRERRLGELAGRDAIGAQHSVHSVARVVVTGQVGPS